MDFDGPMEQTGGRAVVRVVGHSGADSREVRHGRAVSRAIGDRAGRLVIGWAGSHAKDQTHHTRCHQ